MTKHAVIWADGYCVKAKVDGSHAAFPFLSVLPSYDNAWEEAVHWCLCWDAADIEVLNPEQFPADKLEQAKEKAERLTLTAALCSLAREGWQP